MANHRVLITDHPWPGGIEIEQRILAPYGVEIIDAPDADEATLMQLATDVNAIATCWGKVTSKVIEAAPHCQIICRLGIGLDNIDVAAATEKGILVTNVPDYCVEEVADHAMALLLSLIRNVGFFHLRTKIGEYDLQVAPTMHRLRGKTLGILGFGRTAQALHARAKAFGLNVIANTPSSNNNGTDCRMVDLNTLLAESDYLVLQAPLNDQTRHIINAETLAKTKPGVFIINTARGPLIDINALWDAIQSGHVAGAGLDVFEPEPPSLEDPIYKDERVIVTPHAAFVSEESLQNMRVRVAHQIASALGGEIPENVRNPEVLPPTE